MLRCPCGYNTELETEMLNHVEKMQAAGSMEHIPTKEAPKPQGMSNFYG